MHLNDHKPSVEQRSENWIHESYRALVTAILLLFAMTIIGALGYIIIEGWTLREAFFMSVITLSTVGYGEPHELSAGGEIFSICLIMTSMSVAAYCFGVIGRTALQGEIHHYRRAIKMRKTIDSLKGHAIICGYGRLARFIVPDLLDHNTDVVIIENDKLRIAELEKTKIPFIEGNAYEDDTLKSAGVEQAANLITLLPRDADNVFVTLCARHLNEKITISARTETEENEKKLRRAGANHVIAPFRVSATRAVQQLLHPYVNDFLHIATDESGENLSLEQIVLPKNSPLNSQTLAESGIRQKTGVIVAACIDRQGKMILSPDKDTELVAGSTLILLGTERSLERFGEVMEGEL